MPNKGFNLKKGIFLLLLWLPVLCAAQAGNSSISSLSGSSPKNAAGSDHSFFAGTGFGSNMLWLGSTISGNKPYYYASAVYGFKNKLYFSASPVHLQGFDPFIAFYIGSASFSHTFNSWFDASAGVYRYQVPQSLADTLFSSFTYGDITLGFDWRILYTKITAGGLFSEENQAYFQLRNSHYFQTRDFFNGKASISFDPYINLVSGTLYEVSTTNETKVIASTPGRKWKKNSNQNSTTIITYSRKFGFIEADFGIPVALNTDLMTIEAEVSYTLPLHGDQMIMQPKGMIVTLSAFFRIL